MRVAGSSFKKANSMKVSYHNTKTKTIHKSFIGNAKSAKLCTLRGRDRYKYLKGKMGVTLGS